jgi:integrase
MSVKIRPYQGGPEWEVDIRVVMPDGTPRRERRKAPVASKSAALRWGQAREREILREDPRTQGKEVAPTLREFASRFMSGYAEANRQKPSGIAAKRTIIDNHLVPVLGDKRLDEIGNEDVQRLKNALKERAPKTVNNVLSVLNTMLRTAVDWKVILAMPCRVRMLRVPRTEMRFYDFDEFERLVVAAETIDANTALVVLLGGEAGLRCGEIMALEWGDVDLKRKPAHLVVRRSEWKGQVTAPKSERFRRVPLTGRLAGALKEYKHLRGPRVVCQEDGAPLTQKVVQGLVRRAAQKAGLTDAGVHMLRHTFCSHLAMRGASAKAIQELAGHKDLTTTQIYMHLSPAALEDAISLLDGHSSRRNSWRDRGGGGNRRPKSLK